MKARHFSTITILSFIILLATQCSKTDVVGSKTASLNTFNNKPVGSSAKEILTGEKPEIIFEINYMPGTNLQASTLNNLTTWLNTYTNKKSYQVVQKELPASRKDSLSLTEIDKLERANRTTFNTDKQVSVYILITDGRAGSADVLGYAYRNTSIVLFGRTMSSFSGGVNQIPRGKLETVTLEHEFGHLLGLVNVGSPMQTTHNDPSHREHCINRSCLMYWQTETSQFLGRMVSGTIPPLDANCRKDLIANGGK